MDRELSLLGYYNIVREAVRRTSPYDENEFTHMYWDLEDPDWKTLRDSSFTQWNYFALHFEMHLIMSGWNLTYKEVAKIGFTDTGFLSEDESCGWTTDVGRDENFSKDCAKRLDTLNNKEKTDKLESDILFWGRVILKVLKENNGKIDIFSS